MAQQTFVITDPLLPDNPIVFASQGFLTLTGYSLDQVSVRGSSSIRFARSACAPPPLVTTIREREIAINDQSDCSDSCWLSSTHAPNQHAAPSLCCTRRCLAVIADSCRARPPTREPSQRFGRRSREGMMSAFACSTTRSTRQPSGTTSSSRRCVTGREASSTLSVCSAKLANASRPLSTGKSLARHRRRPVALLRLRRRRPRQALPARIADS